MGFLPVLRPPACSGSASSGGFSSPLWAVSLCCPYPSGYSHHMGQVCWSVSSFARPTVVVGAAPFLLMDGLRTSV